MKFLVAAALLLPIGLSFAEDVDPLTLKNRALTSYEQQKPAYVVKEEAKTAQIKMQSFDKATVGQTAFIFATEGGESIPRSAMVAILYRDAPCLLQIAQASAMRSAETLYGRAMVPACWGRLVTPTRDEVVIVTKFGDTQTGSLINYAETIILGDGSAKYIGSAMTQEEFKKNVEDYHKAIR